MRLYLSTISYCIDIGNALTEPVAKEIRQQEKHLMDWVKEQAYASDPANQDNSIRNVSGMQLQGKLMGTPSSSVVQERQSDLTVTIQNTINTVNALMSHGLNVLNGFQLVMVCYLFLLGPIAAALFAWPSGVGRSLFRKAYASWLDGVIVLCLWKFWWCIVLLCMLVRLAHGVDYNSQYEMYYYTSFMAILVMIPFQPFEFRPGDVVGQVLEQCGAGSGSGGGGGGSSSSSGGSKGKSSYSSKGSNVGASGSPAGTQSSSSSTAAGQNNSSSISPSGADKLGSNNNGSDLAQTKSGSAGGKSTSEQPIADNKFNVSMDHVKQPPSSIKG